MKAPVGVKVEVGGNVIICENHKTVEENLADVMKALSSLWGYEVDWEHLEQKGVIVTFMWVCLKSE